ncbi:hypothetical protein HRbin11_00144 [bacterium HR11]|nr:hypothetical protein HRbin11_00144 [bacterium HR11]
MTGVTARQRGGGTGFVPGREFGSSGIREAGAGGRREEAAKSDVGT